MALLYITDDRELEFNCHRGQQIVLENFNKYKLITISSGTGSGKTSFGLLWVYLQLSKKYEENGPVSGFIGMPTQGMYADVILPSFKYFFGDLLKAGVYREKDRKFMFTNRFHGSVVHFRHSFEPDRWEGIHADFVWVDEVGQKANPQSLLTVIKDRTRIKKGHILFTTTPYPDNRNSWLYTDVIRRSKIIHLNVDIEKFYEMYKNKQVPEYKTYSWFVKNDLVKEEVIMPKNGNPEYLTIIFPNLINPIYDAKESFEAYSTAVEMKDEVTFRLRHLGEWIESADKLYYAFTEDNIIPEEAVPTKPMIRLFGLDYGGVTAIGAVWIDFDPDTGVYYIVREYKQKGTDYSKHAENIANLNAGDKIDYAFTDPTGGWRQSGLGNMYEYIKYFERFGMPITPYQAISSKYDSLMTLNEMFSNKRILIVDKCKELQYELNNADIDDFSQKSRNTPTDLLDAMRYAIITFERLYKDREGVPVKKDDNINAQQFMTGLNRYFEQGGDKIVL